MRVKKPTSNYEILEKDVRFFSFEQEQSHENPQSPLLIIRIKVIGIPSLHELEFQGWKQPECIL